jgi:hypothetical protein
VATAFEVRSIFPFALALRCHVDLHAAGFAAEVLALMWSIGMRCRQIVLVGRVTGGMFGLRLLLSHRKILQRRVEFADRQRLGDAKRVPGYEFKRDGRSNDLFDALAGG